MRKANTWQDLDYVDISRVNHSNHASTTNKQSCNIARRKWVSSMVTACTRVSSADNAKDNPLAVGREPPASTLHRWRHTNLDPNAFRTVCKQTGVDSASVIAYNLLASQSTLPLERQNPSPLPQLRHVRIIQRQLIRHLRQKFLIFFGNADLRLLLQQGHQCEPFVGRHPNASISAAIAASPPAQPRYPSRRRTTAIAVCASAVANPSFLLQRIIGFLALLGRDQFAGD